MQYILDLQFQFVMVNAACLTRHQIYTGLEYVMGRRVSNGKKWFFALL